jgi:hypothetical protein
MRYLIISSLDHQIRVQKFHERFDKDQAELAEFQKFNPYFEHKIKPETSSHVSIMIAFWFYQLSN